MTLEKLILQAAKDESHRRARVVDVSRLNPDIISNGHKPQCQLLKRVNESIVRRALALCSRRAAKTVTNMAILATRAQLYPNTTHLYFGAVAKQVKLLIWGPVWQHFRAKWGVGGTDDNQMMWTRFNNGSQVILTGTDDYRHVETFLGGKYKTAIIDEAQSQPVSVLTPLVDRILPPALSDEQGLLLLTGTVPEVQAGLFYEIWSNRKKYAGWRRFNWSRFQNPHIESVERLKEELKDSGRTLNDPLIQRDWFGKFVFDTNDTAFRYNRDVAGYEGVRHSGVKGEIVWEGKYPATLKFFSVGIDPGACDRTAIVVWGWSETDKCLYHVYEWVSQRNSAMTMSKIAEQLAIVKQKFGVNGKAILAWYMDMGGSKVAIDTFDRDYGVPAILPANKAARRYQVDRLSNLCATGKAKVIIESSLEEDLQRAQWDKDKRAQGKFEWSSVWHPDVGDAGRYGAQGYFDMFKPAKPRESDIDRAVRLENELWQEALQQTVENQPWKTDLTEMLRGEGC